MEIHETFSPWLKAAAVLAFQRGQEEMKSVLQLLVSFLLLIDIIIISIFEFKKIASMHLLLSLTFRCTSVFEWE